VLALAPEDADAHRAMAQLYLEEGDKVQAIIELEDLAAETGLARLILPVYMSYFSAYSTLVKCGYQIDMTMVRMHRGKQEDYEDQSHLVLDDWR
jgi:hypothetical protein